MKIAPLRKEVFDSLPGSIRSGVEALQYDFMKMNQVSDAKFVDQIRDSIHTFFRLLEEAYGPGGEQSLLSDQLKSISDAIQFISGAITNRLQSGRYLYEASLFNPHNMGPFSRVYLFYESFVDLFEQLIVSYNKRKNERGADSKLSLLVDISKSSAVQAEVFVPYTGHKFPKNVLIGITINEHAFFQIKETIVLLLHEIGHYVRPFARKKRNQLLAEIVFDWLAKITYLELFDYLHLNAISLYYDGPEDEVHEKIKSLKAHFEEVLSPAVEAVIYKALKDGFEDFIRPATGDQYINLLGEFQRLLQFFFDDLTTDLSKTLFSITSEVDNNVNEELGDKKASSKLGIKSRIINLMQKEGAVNKLPRDQTKLEDKVATFDHLCKSATQLFNLEGIFEYKSGDGNSAPNPAIDCYIDCLSLLGLNEPSIANRKLFANVLIQSLQRSLENFKDKSILDMLILNLEESVAHLFWIRTLEIKDFETYWKIVKPLMYQSVLSDRWRVRFFGIPNAIITEYFALLENRAEATQPYKIPAIMPSSPNSGNDSEPSKNVEDKMLDWLRETLFKRVAKYLYDENTLFPEKEFFQLGARTTSKNGKFISSLREQFRNFMNNTEAGSKFSSELEMIKFFDEFIEEK